MWSFLILLIKFFRMTITCFYFEILVSLCGYTDPQNMDQVLFYLNVCWNLYYILCNYAMCKKYSPILLNRSERDNMYDIKQTSQNVNRYKWLTHKFRRENLMTISYFSMMDIYYSSKYNTFICSNANERRNISQRNSILVFPLYRYDKPQNVVYSISNGWINDITFTDGRWVKKFEKNQFNTDTHRYAYIIASVSAVPFVI